MKRQACWISMAITVAGAGCGARPDPTLPAEAFVSRRPAVGPGSNEPIARGGVLTYDAQHAPTELTPERKPIPPVVKQVVEASDPAGPAANPAAQTPPVDLPATTVPATSPSGITTAQYQVVGAVLAEVNGKPIFADRVLARLDREFAAEARRRGYREFMVYASEQVSKQLSYLINSEVEFVAADKSLKKEDHDLARNLTVEWRKSQTRLTGGSKVLSEQQAAAAGIDSDEAAQEEYRSLLAQIYLQRKIFPLIEISADDIRRDYQQNIAQYTTAEAAQFRVVKIDNAKSGGKEKARAKAQEIVQRAKSGEDFADLAGRFNDDPTLMKNKGAVGENGQMPKGAYVVEPVENAVWKLHPGDITDPIDTSDAYYIAKVEGLQPGGTKPFSDPQVQETIYSKLERQQLDKLRTRHLDELRKNAVIVPIEGMDQVVMEMIAQKYTQWVRK